MLYKDRLKRLREEKELTQAFLAELLNIHEFVYGQYEREYTIMPIRHLNTLSNYFNVSVDYLFSFSLEKNYGNIRSSIDLNIVALRLKEFRKENKLTQESLAQLLNVVKGTVGNYESGRALIATPFLYEICKKYKISADYLLGKIDEPKYLK
ncbi:MAG: helix-turn-helix transcriptional regulator [Bacilli bacterium]|jgi:transcriptional regulator with XRE-family HTH domain|nr:helix-turn-helix transcriptional regulator [Bacilli bacterium]